MKEMNVIGTMQLLAACQKAPSVRRLVLKSTTAVYGSSSRDPAIFNESMAPKDLPPGGYAKDAAEIEGYLRGFARRRPDVAVTVLRFANFIGPRIDTVFTRYFALPVVPTVLGYDARVQLLHEEDGLAVLERATSENLPGVFNVAADGVLLLSQAIRRAGRLPLAGAHGRGRAARPAVPRCPAGRLLPGADAAAQLRPGGRQHASCASSSGSPRAGPPTQAFDDYVRGRALTPAARPGPVRGRGAGRAGRGQGAAMTARSAGSGRRGRSPASEARVIPLHPDESGGAPAGGWATGRRPGAPTDPVQPPPAGARRRRARSRTPGPDAAAGRSRRRPGSGRWPTCWRSCAAGLAGDYAVDDFGFDPDLTDNVLLPALRPLYQRWFRVETIGMHHVPDTGGALVVANHSGTLPLDSLMLAVAVHDDHPAQRHLRMLGADLMFRMPVLGALARKGGQHAGLQPGRRAAAAARGAGRRLAGGLQGHRQAVPGPLQAAALRPRRFRLGRAAHRRADHPVLHRRRRGDLPEDRRPEAAGPAARRPVPAGDAAVPAARPARADPAAVQVVHRVRRADRHRRPRRRPRPTTR